MFLETFKGTLRIFKRSSKGVSSEFKGSFKDISWMLQRCLKKVPSFSFAILLVHGSHRSYPSRRRACFGPETDI